jgi:hypothetical protein
MARKHRGAGVSRQMGEVRGRRMGMSESDAACGYNVLGGTRMGRDAKSMQLTDASSGRKRDAIQTLNEKGS